MKRLAALMVMAVAVAANAQAPTSGTSSVKNVVLVHGSFADGSGWRDVATILQKDGFHVSVVQEPETSLDDDVKATTRIIDLQNGPVVLVGHSYGGVIATEAGNDPKVAALVYVAAFAPDEGESAGDLLKQIPSASTAITPTSDGFVYLNQAAFHQDFAADLPADEVQFMSISQVLTNGAAFGQTVTSPAWKSKPSWAVVATQDRAINPALERFMYKRAGSHVIELKSSHVAYMSHPKEVAAVIEKAAAGTTKAS